MESLHAPPNFMDDLLDFSSDIGEETDNDNDNDHHHHHHHNNHPTKTLNLPFPLLLPSPGVMVEEELEWISNKDAFPMVESLVDMIPNHHSPVSVLDTTTPSSSNSNASTSTNRGSGGAGGVMASILSFPVGFKVPVKARTKKLMRRREVFDGQQWKCWAKESKKITKQRAGASRPSSTLGRKCLHCQSEKTPQWRAGPMGPKTLCNACGVRYKSGRLVPEYRPACSPTFSSEVHSNSHRKIVEMRRQKQVGGLEA